MKSFFKKAKKFVGHDVWEKTEADFSSRKEWWFVRQARLILYTAQGVQHHNTVVRSAALTFFTLMSLVPMLALAFGIIKGFGLETALENYLFERFSENSALIRYILNFANNVLVRTSGGLVAASGLVVLVWAAIRVFGNVENAFNTIWEVQKPRSLTRRASTYAAVIFVMPLLAVMLALVLSYIRTLIANYASIPYSVLYAIGSFAVLWLLFAGAYKIIPNTKVRFRHAAMAALIAAIAFSVFQLVYVTLQSGVSSYNIIYGSFAAVPPVSVLDTGKLANRPLRSRTLVLLPERGEFRAGTGRRECQLRQPTQSDARLPSRSSYEVSCAAKEASPPRR